MVVTKGGAAGRRDGPHAGPPHHPECPARLSARGGHAPGTPVSRGRRELKADG